RRRRAPDDADADWRVCQAIVRKCSLELAASEATPLASLDQKRQQHELQTLEHDINFLKARLADLRGERERLENSLSNLEELREAKRRRVD
ncbi:unnamed protein product, partial [Cladocopium goreaui]